MTLGIFCKLLAFAISKGGTEQQRAGSETAGSETVSVWTLASQKAMGTGPALLGKISPQEVLWLALDARLNSNNTAQRTRL